MPNLADIIIFTVLLFVISLQALDRYVHNEADQKERSKLIGAILAKNATEYQEIIKTEKDDKPAFIPEPDEIDLSTANEEQFDKFIKEQTA